MDTDTETQAIAPEEAPVAEANALAEPPQAEAPQAEAPQVDVVQEAEAPQAPTYQPRPERTNGNGTSSSGGNGISMKALLEAGVHFGHQTKRWNPKMKPYIFTERNGIHIIDLQQ